MNAEKNTGIIETKRLFGTETPIRDEVILRPDMDSDYAALRLGPRLCVVSIKPMTLSSKELGSLLLHTCCNEIAASGADPVGVGVCLYAPSNVKEDRLDAILDQIRQTAGKLNVEILGGSVEKTNAVTRLIACGTGLGSCPEGRISALKGVKPGDDLVLTKWAGMEATYRMSLDYASVVMQHLGQEGYHACLAYKEELSAVQAGIEAARQGAHAILHLSDGGVLGGVYQMCHAANCGVYLTEQHIPVLQETEQLCHSFSLDPLRLTSTGCMLIAAENGKSMVRALEELDIPAAIIGQVKYADTGMRIQCLDGMTREIAPPGVDEFFRFSEHMAETEVSLNQG